MDTFRTKKGRKEGEGGCAASDCALGRDRGKAGLLFDDDKRGRGGGAGAMASVDRGKKGEKDCRCPSRSPRKGRKGKQLFSRRFRRGPNSSFLSRREKEKRVVIRNLHRTLGVGPSVTKKRGRGTSEKTYETGGKKGAESPPAGIVSSDKDEKKGKKKGGGR